MSSERINTPFERRPGYGNQNMAVSGGSILDVEMIVDHEVPDALTSDI